MVAESLLRDHDLSLERTTRRGATCAFHDAPLEPHYRVRGKNGRDLLAPRGRPFAADPARLRPGRLSGRVLIHGVPGRAPRPGDPRGAAPGRSATGLAEAAGWIVALSPPLLHYAGPRLHRGAGRACSSRSPCGGERGSRAGLAIALLALAERAVCRPLGRPSSLRSLAIGVGRARRSSPCPPARFGGRERSLPLRRSTVSSTRAASTAGGRSSRWRPLPEGLPGLFLDQEFGLFVYAPCWRWPCPVSSGSGAGIARGRWPPPALVGVVVLTSATWHMWRGGFNPPGRFLVPVVPALALLAAGALAGGLARGSGAARGLEPLGRSRRGGRARGSSIATATARLRSSAASRGPRSGRVSFRDTSWPSPTAAGSRSSGRGLFCLPFPGGAGGATAPRLAVAATGLPRRRGDRLVPVRRAHGWPRRRPARGPRRAGRTRLVLDREHTRGMGTGSAWSGGRSSSPTAIPKASKLGSRLPLPPGEYELRIEAERLGEAPHGSRSGPIGLEPWRRPGHAGRDAIRAGLPRFRVAPEDGPVTLRLRGGGPLCSRDCGSRPNPRAPGSVQGLRGEGTVR